jgi:uncharacterized protein
MRLLFIINTPAQAHTWHYIIKELMVRGHDIKILARDYGSTPELLASFGFHFDMLKIKGNGLLRFMTSMDHIRKCYTLSRKFDPNIVIGFGVDAAINAKLMRGDSIVFIDDDPTHFQNNLTKLLGSTILTPNCFLGNLGRKHIRIQGYKELAYLHPNYFKPDPSIYDELKINRGEKYVILRFNVFDAIHDVGIHGFSVTDQFALVKELGKYAHVFISPEGNLHKDLEKCRLPISYNRIHHALYYAQLLVTDTQTMTTEAAVFGTPVIRSNNFVGHINMGNFIELEEKYALIYSFPNPEQAINKAIELIKQPELKEQWAKKRQVVLSDKIDVTKLMIDFIDNFPQSLLNYTNSRENK